MTVATIITASRSKRHSNQRRYRSSSGLREESAVIHLTVPRLQRYQLDYSDYQSKSAKVTISRIQNNVGIIIIIITTTAVATVQQS